jgi:hypothetical protein
VAIIMDLNFSPEPEAEELIRLVKGSDYIKTLVKPNSSSANSGPVTARFQFCYENLRCLIFLLVCRSDFESFIA